MPTDRRSVIDAEHATLSSPNLPRSGGLENDGPQQRSTPLLGVPLTGNLLFMTSWITGVGIAKAVYSYHGQSVVSPTLDWVGGTVLTLISLWLGVIENKRPDLCQWFFEVDLAPPILWFLCHRTVHLWILSIPPLLLSVTVMIYDANWLLEPVPIAKNIFHRISFGLLVLPTISLFFLCGLRVFWKRGYDRTVYYAPYIIIMMPAFNMVWTVAAIFTSRDYDSEYVVSAAVRFMDTFLNVSVKWDIQWH